MREALKNIFIIFLFILCFEQFLCDIVNNCRPAQTCKTFNKTYVKCSQNGKCFHDIIEYYETNKATPFENCVCENGFTNLNDSDSVKCCYKQSSQFIAFILEAIIGYGSGYFYIGQNAIAYIKLICFIVLNCSCCTIACCLCNKEDNYSLDIQDDVKVINNNEEEEVKTEYEYSLKLRIFNWIMVLSAFIIVVWQIVDALLIGFNVITDSNGKQLNAW